MNRPYDEQPGERVLPAVAVVVLAIALGKVWISVSWGRDLKVLLLALLGFVMFVFPDEVAQTTGGYGWTRAQWRELPAGLVKWAGAAKLAVCTALLLARSP